MVLYPKHYCWGNLSAMLGKNYLVIQCKWNLSSGFVTQLVDHHHRIASCRSFSCTYFSGISLLQNFKEINYVLPPWYIEASLAAGSPFGKKENTPLAKSTSWLWSTPVQERNRIFWVQFSQAAYSHPSTVIAMYSA